MTEIKYSLRWSHLITIFVNGLFVITLLAWIIVITDISFLENISSAHILVSVIFFTHLFPIIYNYLRKERVIIDGDKIIIESKILGRIKSLELKKDEIVKIRFNVKIDFDLFNIKKPDQTRFYLECISEKDRYVFANGIGSFDATMLINLFEEEGIELKI